MLKLGHTGTGEIWGYIYNKLLIFPSLQMSKSVALRLLRELFIGEVWGGGNKAGADFHLQRLEKAIVSCQNSTVDPWVQNSIDCYWGFLWLQKIFSKVHLQVRSVRYGAEMEKENRMELHLWGMRGRWVSRWTSSTHKTDLREAVIHPESTAQSLLCVSPWIEMLRYHRAGGWLSGAEQKVSLYADISTFTFRPVRQVLKRQPEVKKQ